MSITRKIRRQKQLQKKKQTKQSLKQALNAFAGTPTNCSACDSAFDPVEDADTWVVDFSGGTVKLLCPKCA